MCVCVCVREREKVCVCKREREEREREYYMIIQNMWNVTEYRSNSCHISYK